jgi:hypothetical protein
MWRRFSLVPAILVLATLTLISSTLLACGGDHLAHRATSSDPEVAQKAIQQLRALGLQGVQRLVMLREELESLGEDVSRVNAAIDAVGGAKYCSVSELYWYTDLESAQKAAAASDKPILSLRMLGQLTDDLSCANSRFFRTTLYSNKEISEFLRESYVLHWQSVRPVPKVTIDFGDGRTLETTVTGNSAHYVLLADGTVVDCLPGLYGPQAFLNKVKALHFSAKEVSELQNEHRPAWLDRYHREMEANIIAAWQNDLRRIGVHLEGDRRPAKGGYANAAESSALTRPKSAAEVVVLSGVLNRVPVLEKATTEEVWQQLAKLHAAEARLDQGSRELIASHTPTALVAGELAITKSVVESPLARLFRNLESSIAVDTVRNEYDLRRRFHRWHNEGMTYANVDELNERVYAELFLTPRSDPWLGLAPRDAYTGLPNNGVVVKQAVRVP